MPVMPIYKATFNTGRENMRGQALKPLPKKTKEDTFLPGTKVAIVGNAREGDGYYYQGKTIVKGYGVVIKDYGRFVLLNMGHYKESFLKQNLRKIME
jgi:hypothetical protein